MHKIKLALLSTLTMALSGCGGADDPASAPQKSAAELAYISDSSPIAKARLDALTPNGHMAVIHLTITDDFPLAQAIVVISALPFGAENVNI